MNAMTAQTLLRIARRDLRYGYFAPVQALWLMCWRPGGYVRHLTAPYRLAFGR